MAWKKFDPEKGAMWPACNKKCNVNWCFEGSALQDPFSHSFLLICFYSVCIQFSMDCASINALYAGSLRIKVLYFFSEKSDIL